MATVTFALDQRKNSKATEFPIAARIRSGSSSRFDVYPFDRKLQPEKWDAANQRMRGASRDVQQFNLMLSDFRNKVEDIYLTLKEQSKNGRVCLETFKQQVKFGDKPAAPEPEPEDGEATIINLLEEYVAANDFKPKNTVIYDTAIKHLQRFSKDTKTSIALTDFSVATYNKFKLWLVVSNKMINDTANKYLKKLQAAVRWHIKFNSASVGGSLSEDACARLSIMEPRMTLLQAKDKDKICPTEDEIELLYYLDLSDYERLDKVRDIAVFAAWTGPRIGTLLGDPINNVKPLRKENLLRREQVLRFYAGKTNDLQATEVPCNDIVLDIAAKYDYLPDTLLPKISHQNANDYIHEIMRVLADFANVATDDLATWETVQQFKHFEKVNKWLHGVNNENWRYWGQKCSTFADFHTEASMVNNRVAFVTKPRCEALTFHSFRRFFITYLIDNGASLEDAGKLASQSDIRTTRKYDKSTNTKAVERARGLLKGRDKSIGILKIA